MSSLPQYGYPEPPDNDCDGSPCDYPRYTCEYHQRQAEIFRMKMRRVHGNTKPAFAMQILPYLEEVLSPEEMPF